MKSDELARICFDDLEAGDPEAQAALAQSFLKHSFAYVKLGGAHLKPLARGLAQYADIITSIAAAPAALQSVQGIVYKEHREKWQVHYQKVRGGWAVPGSTPLTSAEEKNTFDLALMTTTTTTTATTTTTTTTKTLHAAASEFGTITRCLGMGEDCWVVMEHVGLTCLDVLGKKVGFTSAQAVLDDYCDPDPLPFGMESSSVFDVFLYHNDNAKLCNCPDHFDPGFFSIIKDDKPGLQARDFTTDELLDLAIGADEVVIILNRALRTISRDQVPATLHQVRNSEGARVSMIYELRPNPDRFYDQAPDPDVTAVPGVSSAMIFDVLLSNLEKELRDGSGAAIAAFVAKARTQLEGTLGAVEIERTKGLAEVAKEKDDLQREIAAMQKQQEAQHGRIVLGIGGYRYTTSVQTLRRLPGTFFDAYFSGRYTMDRSEDGSIFIDRDGKHFGQVLEYLRRGVVSAAEREASELDVGELRWLQREFGFYCIELFAEPQDVAFVVGGAGVVGSTLASVERYDAVSGAWREAASMTTARAQFGLCKLSDGDIYATGGVTSGDVALASVECYDSSLNIWSAAPSLPRPRWAHYACAVGNTMYIIGGIEEDGEGGDETVNSVLKFDCRMQTWSEGPPLPEGRFNPGACVSGCNIYIFGGRTENYGTASTSFRFNTETNEWATLAPMPEANSLHSTSILDALIYVMGGSDSDGNTNSAVHRFDPVANLWSTVAPMSIARSMLGSFVTGGSIYAVGGSDGENTWLSSMERYSVGSDSWSEVPGGEMGTARDLLRTLVVRLEVDLFESLIAKAKIEGL